ncbi:MAG: CoA transferase [Chloroflexi bacterium]|nr:CoA transferase [Chloroflexota bacterium]
MGQPPLFLAPYRVLDLTLEHGHVAGRVLSDLGADVIKVEPPGGDPARRRPPFHRGVPHPERSYLFWSYNLNKRGITLDINVPEGREMLRRLAQRSDILLESFPPGHMERLGIGYEHLRQPNPRLIYASITDFGSTGPYADFQAPDIVVQAMGGLMFLAGDPDRAPLRIPFPQAYLHAGAQAAVGAMIALFSRQRTGQGQRVDVSAQQSMAWTLMNAAPTWDLNRRNITRLGPFRSGGASQGLRLLWPCQDGHVCFSLLGGFTGGNSSNNLVRWMAQEGQAPDYLSLYDFRALEVRDLPPEEVELISAAVDEFFRSRTKQQLFEGALKHRVMLYPVSTMRDLAENQHLAARGFFIRVHHPELGEDIIYPGLVPRFNDDMPAVRRRPPLLGEHNQEVFCGELGLSQTELDRLKSIGVV